MSAAHLSPSSPDGSTTSPDAGQASTPETPEKSRKQMKLGIFLQETGHHIAGWRHPDARADAALDFSHYLALAQEAERGLFDLLFIQDSAAMRGAGNLAALSRTARAVTWEPMTTLAALSQATRHIGLIGTATTSYNEPYQVARQFASLDRISGGRAGWNLVTSNNEAEALNFSRERHPLHDDRYARAEAFVNVVKGLWDSWDDAAFVLDKARGVFFEPDDLQFLNYRDEHFQVRGPLTVARPPQGYPLLVQAGSSPAGKALGAAHADLIFTAQSTRADSQAFVASMRALAKIAGAPLVLPGLMPIIGRTREEAQQKWAQLQSLVDPALALATLSTTLGEVDLSAFPIDGPLPPLPPANGPQSRREMLVSMAREEGLTIRQLALRVTGARGHLCVIGTASDIADTMEDWFRHDAADGFNIMPAQLPDGLREFVDHVVPELQRRGLFRRAYEPGTLRDRLGLPRPERRAAAVPHEAEQA